MNILPFFIYWFLSTDVSDNVDTCRNNISKETGFCLTEWMCESAKGTNIGSCDNDLPDAMCCKITLRYLNNTYYLSSLFLKKSQSGTADEWNIFNSDEQGHFKTQYRNESLSPEHMQRLTFIDSANQNPQATHKITFPISIKRKVSVDNTRLQFNLSSDADFRYVFILEKSDSYVHINIGRGSKDFRRSFVSNASYDGHHSVSIKPLVFRVNDFLFNEMLQHVQMNSTLEVHILLKRDAPYDMRLPLQTDATHDMRKEREPTHDMRRLREPTHDMRRQIEATHDMRKEEEATHDMRMSSKIDATRNMQRPVQTDASYNTRSEQRKVTHNMRKSVETDETHDRRKPVQRESTHHPTQRGVTHESRRPVALEESHDLRWPVIDEETRDLRNSEREGDAFRGSSIDRELHEMISAHQILEAIRNASISEKYLSNETWIDRFLKCKKDILYMNESSSNMGPSQLRSIHMETKYSDLWLNAFAVCGSSSGKLMKPASDRMQEKWPWMLALQEYYFGRYWYKCGAALLNNYWVVTAAHCVDMKPKWDFLLRLDSQGKVNEHKRYYFAEILVDEIVVHPKFNRGNLEHDIALIRMETPVEFQSDVSPICLPWNVGELEGHRAVVLGWKLISRKLMTPVGLKDVTVPLMTNRECEITFSAGKNKERARDTFVCENVGDGKSYFCDGDSGGPLTVLDKEGKWSLIGLVSWGSMCTTSEHPGTYIRISNYAKWITDVVDCYESLM